MKTAAVLGFKGGKGVATLLGTLIGLSPVIGLIALASWLFTYFVFRYSSLSAIMSALVTPAVALILGFGQAFVVMIIMAALLIWRHKENIMRLRDQTKDFIMSLNVCFKSPSR